MEQWPLAVGTTVVPSWRCAPNPSQPTLRAALARGPTGGTSQALDETILLAMRDAGDRGDAIGPRWLEEFGGVAVVSGVTMLAAGRRG